MRGNCLRLPRKIKRSLVLRFSYVATATQTFNLTSACNAPTVNSRFSRKPSGRRLPSGTFRTFYLLFSSDPEHFLFFLGLSLTTLHKLADCGRFLLYPYSILFLIKGKAFCLLQPLIYERRHKVINVWQECPGEKYRQLSVY